MGWEQKFDGVNKRPAELPSQLSQVLAQKLRWKNGANCRWNFQLLLCWRQKTDLSFAGSPWATSLTQGRSPRLISGICRVCFLCSPWRRRVAPSSSPVGIEYC
ncbi:hypothetical protein MGG_14810 [Pyricularia oryzae 70-15]|uniref:Uncharacterized protein n=3 Tax=Pyricularia oryzae TaxID=318829 RepID=G4MUT7_PYRO7|nr:uncharacterized protein MGG_14810 [Pyricularia oryzae 70-15]EHA54867.1 hypothetical protein MGG_14810 [Pyricularia oryzae 70-15]ELQ43525.1 hypothetical protein OOU_Y34scaffold00147g7 [Pyricularia oryzae Y34]